MDFPVSTFFGMILLPMVMVFTLLVIGLFVKCVFTRSKPCPGFCCDDKYGSRTGGFFS